MDLALDRTRMGMVSDAWSCSECWTGWRWRENGVECVAVEAQGERVACALGC